MAKMTSGELAATKSLFQAVTAWVIAVGLAIKTGGATVDTFGAADDVADAISDFSRDGDE